MSNGIETGCEKGGTPGSDGGGGRFVFTVTELGRRAVHLRNVASFGAARVAALAMYLIPVPLFIKHHGDAAYGTLALMLLVFSYVQIFDLGVGYAVNQRLGRAVARGNRRTLSIVQTALPTVGVIALGGAAVLVMSAKWVAVFLLQQPEHMGALRGLAVAIGLLSLSAVLTAVFQAYNRVDWINYTRLILDVSRASGILIGAFVRDGVDVAVTAMIIGCAVKGCAELFLAARLLADWSAFVPKLRLRATAVNLRLGLPMLGSVVLGMVMASGDRFFVIKMFGKQALAHYSVGADLCSRAYFLVYAVTGSIYTLYVRRRAYRRSSNDLIRASLLAVAVVGLIFYAPIGIFAPQVIRLWINPVFALTSAGVTRIWSLAAMTYLVSCVYCAHLQGVGRPGILVANGILGVALLAAGLVFLPGRFGIEGVALSVLLGFAAQAAFLWTQSRRAMTETRAWGATNGIQTAERTQGL